MNNIEIREPSDEEFEQFIELIQSLAEYEKLEGPSLEARERLIRHASEPDSHYEVRLAFLDGQAIGYTVFFTTYSTFLAKPTLFIEDIFVREKFRGKGTGRALFMHCAREAKKRGCGRVEWFVLDWNKPALNFYQKMGAQRLSEWILHRLTEEDLDKLTENEQ